MKYSSKYNKEEMKDMRDRALEAYEGFNSERFIEFANSLSDQERSILNEVLRLESRGSNLEPARYCLISSAFRGTEQMSEPERIKTVLSRTRDFVELHFILGDLSDDQLKIARGILKNANDIQYAHNLSELVDKEIVSRTKKLIDQLKYNSEKREIKYFLNTHAKLVFMGTAWQLQGLDAPNNGFYLSNSAFQHLTEAFTDVQVISLTN